MRKYRWSGGLLAAVVVSLSLAGQAAAWQPEYPCGTWNNYSCTHNWGYDTVGGICVKDYAEASNDSNTWGQGGGFSKGNVASFVTTFSQGTPDGWCSNYHATRTKGPEQLNVHIQYWKYFVINNRGWAVCRDYSRIYNSAPGIDNFTVYAGFPNSSPCGPGWYETHMSGYVWNGAWFGGQDKSGQNYIYK